MYSGFTVTYSDYRVHVVQCKSFVLISVEFEFSNAPHPLRKIEKLKFNEKYSFTPFFEKNLLNKCKRADYIEKTF